MLCAVQPLLDVLSYWTQGTSFGSALTTIIRAALLIGVIVYAFCLSERKKVYVFSIAVCVVLYAGHLVALFAATDNVSANVILEDFANYMRVIQMPLFAIAFISFLRKCEDGFESIQKGLLIAFFIIAAVEILSAITGTNPYTYPNKEIGLLGWFYFANSQSAVLSMLFPIVLCTALNEEKFWLSVLISIIGFGELYLFATRLAYLAIFATALGTLLTWLVCKRLDAKKAILLLVCAGICAAGYNISPMIENRRLLLANEDIKQQEIYELVEKGEKEFGKDDFMYLKYAYEEYLGGMVDRFGLEKVADVFDYSIDKDDVANARTRKINYCKLLLDEKPMLCKVFGLPYDCMTYNGVNYDVENDFHGVIYLYGWAGFAALAAFLLYFAFIVIKALLKDAKKYYTVEAGASGIALLMGLIHAYSTAGVLRRPNASFYLSVALSIIWYLIYIKHNDDQKEN